MGFRNQIVAATALIRSAIQSPNYDPGVAGWSVNKDGSAEFSSLLVSGGEITATRIDGTSYTDRSVTVDAEKVYWEDAGRGSPGPVWAAIVLAGFGDDGRLVHQVNGEPVLILTHDPSGFTHRSALFQVDELDINGTDVLGEWQDYTPTLASGSIGNGALRGRYQKIGKTVTASIEVTRGSTTSFNPALVPNLPFASKGLSGNQAFIGSIYMRDVGVRNYVGSCRTRNGGATELDLIMEAGNGVSNTQPFASGPGDHLQCTITYEAA